jgi:hypothetical protein
VISSDLKALEELCNAFEVFGVPHISVCVSGWSGSCDVIQASKMVEWHAAQHGLEQWDDALVLGMQGFDCSSCDAKVAAFLQVPSPRHLPRATNVKMPDSTIC